jgi:serine/threonine-protein kinase
VILGTAAYMSPEQARGKPVDRRTDIWSFGCVLYEALAGKQAFSGETTSDTIARILEREPNWEALPEGTPGSVRTLLRRCLRKDARRRLHDAADLRIEIEEALAGGPEAGGAPRARTSGLAISWRTAAALAVVIAAAAGALAWWLAPASSVAPGPVTWLQIELPPDAPLDPQPTSSFALSADGSRLVYVARRPEGSQLFVRSLDQPGVTPIPDTEGAKGPFFSPDGRWVGFFAADKLKKVSLLGGAPVTLHEANERAGGAWGVDHRIYFVSQKPPALLSISEEGGEAEPLVSPGPRDPGRDFRWPHPLPDGRGLLYNVRSTQSLETRVAVHPAGAGEERILLDFCARPVFVPGGYLLCASNGRLMAAAFDPVRLQLGGPAVAMLEDVTTVPSVQVAMFSLSSTGTLAYVRGPVGGVQRTLLWVDRAGEARPMFEGRRLYHSPRFSPDGRRVAVMIAGDERDIWILDLERTALTRLTFEGDSDRSVWAADGARIFYRARREGKSGIWWRPVDSGGAAELLLEADRELIPESASPDGRFLAFNQEGPDTGTDLWILPLTGERKPFPFVSTSYAEELASFSPDGRWIAYTSDESGRQEIYVQPFPGPGAKVQVSTDGGLFPAWTSGGREIVYRQGIKMMAASVTGSLPLGVSKPRSLFEYGYMFVGGSNFAYDVTSDGRRFVMLKSDIESPPTRIDVILNWTEVLKRRVPAGKS